MKTIFNIVLGIVVGAYVLAHVLAWQFQEDLLFHPVKLDDEYVFHAGEELSLTAEDGERICAVYVHRNAEKTVLYFHGNAGALDSWQLVALSIADLNVNVLMIDYRGFGKSSGTISEKGMYQDGHAAFQYLVDSLDVDPQKVIVYGRSLGSGVATELASTRNVGALILESPFSSIPDLTNDKFPFLISGLIVDYEFDNLNKISQVKCPTLFVHGTQDKLIPWEHSQRLYEECKTNKKFEKMLGAGHNNVSDHPNYGHTLSVFLHH